MFSSINTIFICQIFMHHVKWMFRRLRTKGRWWPFNDYVLVLILGICKFKQTRQKGWFYEHDSEGIKLIDYWLFTYLYRLYHRRDLTSEHFNNVRLPPDPWAESGHHTSIVLSLDQLWVWMTCRGIIVSASSWLCVFMFSDRRWDLLDLTLSSYDTRSWYEPLNSSRRASARISVSWDFVLEFESNSFSETSSMLISSWTLNSMVTELAARLARVLSFSDTPNFK